MVRVAINGFGRIGRMVFRACMGELSVDVVAVNDLTDTRTLAHLLKYDSVHGTLDADVSFDDGNIFVNDKKIRVLSLRNPEDLPWGELDIDVVVESTGFFRTRELAGKHLTAGAKKVLLSAPAKSDDVKTIVLGINEHDISSDDLIISNASCTTNCLAPLMKVLNDNFGVLAGFFVTVHSYTGDQRHVDAPHRDLRRARACAANIVPTTSGAAIAATKTIPELAGKVTGYAVRVPTVDGSLTDFTAHLSKEVSVDDINRLFSNVASHHLRGVLRYTDVPLVSSDIIGDPHSAIFDALSTQVIGGCYVRVLAWYDNEWGYSSRMVDLIKRMG